MSIFRKTSTILITTLILSCGSKSDKVLPKEKMGKVLWEVSQGGSFLSNYIYYQNPEVNRAALDNKMLDHILKINKINRKQFDNSIEFYRNHPKELKIILDTITAQKKRLIDEENSIRKKDTIPGVKPLTPKTL